MSDIVERLRRVGSERQRTTAHDTPDHYLHVVAKISNADGLLMREAADRIEQLEAALADSEKRFATLKVAWEAERRKPIQIYGSAALGEERT